jgi:hypothetical protein
MVTLERDSGFPRDRSVNTFHFVTPGIGAPLDADLANIGLVVNGFYNGVQVGGNKVANYLSPKLATGAVHTIKQYVVIPGPDGPPVKTTPLDLGATPGASPIPSEVALCLSYKADPTVITNPRRSRGRIYLGPLNITALGGTETEADGTPHMGLLNTLFEAGKKLREDPLTEWVVYSRAGGYSAPVSKVSVDNAFDTQRRRGGRPTTKLVG